MNTNILENKLERLIQCLQDAGKDPQQWIIEQLKRKQGLDAMDLMNSEICKREGGCQCQHKK